MGRENQLTTQIDFSRDWQHPGGLAPKWMPLWEERVQKLLERQIQALEICHAKKIVLSANPNLRPFPGGQANSCCFVNNQYLGKRWSYTCSSPDVLPQTLNVKVSCVARRQNFEPAHRFIQEFVHKLGHFFKFSYSQLLLLALYWFFNLLMFSS